MTINLIKLSKVYLVPTQTSMVKFFAKIVNDSVKAVNYFRKKNFILDA